MTSSVKNLTLRKGSRRVAYVRTEGITLATTQIHRPLYWIGFCWWTQGSRRIRGDSGGEFFE